MRFKDQPWRSSRFLTTANRTGLGIDEVYHDIRECKQAEDVVDKLTRQGEISRDSPTAIGYNSAMRLTAIYKHQAEGGYHASCPLLPGCHSEGDTLNEAVAHIREAIGVYVESMIAHGETLPFEHSPNALKEDKV